MRDLKIKDFLLKIKVFESNFAKTDYFRSIKELFPFLLL